MVIPAPAEPDGSGPNADEQICSQWESMACSRDSSMGREGAERAINPMTFDIAADLDST